jgi:hypothetical protein
MKGEQRMSFHWFERLPDELAQCWAVAVKDVRVYYMQPPMIMFGLLLPLFLFFSFSIKREIGPEVGLARLLAMTIFFTASSAGPVIIPMERRTRTYDRLLVAPMSLLALLLGKTLVGAFFGIAVAAVPLLIGLAGLGLVVANFGLLVAGIVFGSLAAALYQRHLCAVKRDGSVGARPGLPLALDLRSRLDEPRCVGRGVSELLARPGSVTNSAVCFSHPGRPPAPAQPGAGLLTHL